MCSIWGQFFNLHFAHVSLTKAVAFQARCELVFILWGWCPAFMPIPRNGQTLQGVSQGPTEIAQSPIKGNTVPALWWAATKHMHTGGNFQRWQVAPAQKYRNSKLGKAEFEVETSPFDRQGQTALLTVRGSLGWGAGQMASSHKGQSNLFWTGRHCCIQ